MDGILNNWNREYISDIKYITNIDNCPIDYNENIIHYEWPGTSVYFYLIFILIYL